MAEQLLTIVAWATGLLQAEPHPGPGSTTALALLIPIPGLVWLVFLISPLTPHALSQSPTLHFGKLVFVFSGCSHYISEPLRRNVDCWSELRGF